MTSSRTASEIWSAILSGWPSVTDSDVNRKLRKASLKLILLRVLGAEVLLQPPLFMQPFAKPYKATIRPEKNQRIDCKALAGALNSRNRALNGKVLHSPARIRRL